MSTFLYFAGFILLILVLKFIYDSYLTDNTEREWQRYKNDFPEKARKIEGTSKNKEVEKNSLKSDDDEIKFSIGLMAKSYECEPWEVKRYYFDEIKKNNIHKMTFDEVKKIISPHIEKQASMYNIKKENTGAAISLKWLEEEFYKEKKLGNDKIRDWFLLKINGFNFENDFKNCPDFLSYVQENFESFKANPILKIQEYNLKIFKRLRDKEDAYDEFRNISQIGVLLSENFSDFILMNNYIIQSYIWQFQLGKGRDFLYEAIDYINNVYSQKEEFDESSFAEFSDFLRHKTKVLIHLNRYEEAVESEEESKKYEELANQYEKNKRDRSKEIQDDISEGGDLPF